MGENPKVVRIGTEIFFKTFKLSFFPQIFVYFQGLDVDSQCESMRVLIRNLALRNDLENQFLSTYLTLSVLISLWTGEISNSEYELTFLASVGGLGLETFYLRQLRSDEEPSDQLSIATLRLFHTDREPFQVSITFLSQCCGFGSGSTGSKCF